MINNNIVLNIKIYFNKIDCNANCSGCTNDTSCLACPSSSNRNLFNLC